MDKIGADFFNCVKDDQGSDGRRARAPVQLPIGAEDQLEGIVDLVTMKEWVWKGEDLGASWVIRGHPRRASRTRREEYRATLVELAVEHGRRRDGEIPRGGGARPLPTLRALIRKGTLSMSFVPVLCGSAFKNKGVQPLLNAVIDYLPGPLDVPPIHGLCTGRRDGDT